jgi:hypothetical protein
MHQKGCLGYCSADESECLKQFYDRLDGFRNAIESKNCDEVPDILEEMENACPESDKRARGFLIASKKYWKKR